MMKMMTMTCTNDSTIHSPIPLNTIIETNQTEHYLTTHQRQIRSGTSSLMMMKKKKIPKSDDDNNNNNNNDPTLQILSKDPLIYLVSNFLSSQECNEYIHHVQELESLHNRPMTCSNPPAISIDASKLWPLLILSLGAGIPPIIRYYQTTEAFTIHDVMLVALENVIGALIFSIALAYGVVLPYLQSSMYATSRRTSYALALNEKDDIDFIRPLVDRVVTWSGSHPWMRWEAPVVTRYDPGAYFTRHNDASPTRGSEWIDFGGQRLVTCICYLNSMSSSSGGGSSNSSTGGGSSNISSGGGSDSSSTSKAIGGETYFDQLHFSILPQQGSALFFFPANTETLEADDRTTHESRPTPYNQNKWIVQLFGRTSRVPAPLGIPDDFMESMAIPFPLRFPC
jgi:uncharacterized membrane protein YgcG